MEDTREVTGITAIPAGVGATGTLSQDANVPNVLLGTGTLFSTEIGQIPRPFLFFPNTTPPQMLEVQTYNGDEWVKVKNTPGVAISGESFEIVDANLASFSVTNKGVLPGKYDNISLPAKAVFEEPVIYKSGNSCIIPKDAHWVDGTGTTLFISENSQ